MRINVHLEDAVLPVEVGEGRQRLKWLATVSCTRYGLLQNGHPHQFVPMRMERQATDGEVLPNARSRVLHPRSIINVALEDDAHITLWIRDTSMDERLHFSDSVLAGSVPNGNHAFHMSRLQAETTWSKGFEVGKGQSGQDALRHVIHIAAYSKNYEKNTEEPHKTLWHIVNPSWTSMVTTEALHNYNVDPEEKGVIWSKRFQEAWDKTDIFDLLVTHDTAEGGVVRGPNLGTNERLTYSDEQQRMLLHLGECLYSHFDVLSEVFDQEAITDTMTSDTTMSMHGFFNILKKCYVPHPEVPLAQLDRIFVEVNWATDAARDHSARSMDLAEFLEGLIRVSEARYAVEDPPIPLVERLEHLLTDKIMPNVTEGLKDPFARLQRSMPFRTLLVNKRLPLLKAFQAFAAVDQNMSFHTMSLKEWASFVEILQLPGPVLSFRQGKEIFWRAQGAFESTQEREDFIEKLAGDEDAGADHGSAQEMTYVEYAEGVSRIAYHMHMNLLESDELREAAKEMTEETGAAIMKRVTEVVAIIERKFM